MKNEDFSYTWPSPKCTHITLRAEAVGVGVGEGECKRLTNKQSTNEVPEYRTVGETRRKKASSAKCSGLGVCRGKETKQNRLFGVRRSSLARY